jgi:hypothetical protein
MRRADAGAVVTRRGDRQPGIGRHPAAELAQLGHLGEQPTPERLAVGGLAHQLDRGAQLGLHGGTIELFKRMRSPVSGSTCRSWTRGARIWTAPAAS